MLGRGKRLRFDFTHVGLDRALHAAGTGEEILDETRFLAGIDVEHVVQDEDLARAINTRAYAYGRDAQRRSHLARQRSGNQLQHQHTGAGLFQHFCFGDQLFRLGVGLALDAVATQRVD